VTLQQQDESGEIREFAAGSLPIRRKLPILRRNFPRFLALTLGHERSTLEEQ
jgi:hypothetical protein